MMCNFTIHPLSLILIIFITIRHLLIFFFFFFNDTATTEIYTLSLHDALPILSYPAPEIAVLNKVERVAPEAASSQDRKSTRLNSSHLVISYAVFCLKKKKKK